MSERLPPQSTFLVVHTTCSLGVGPHPDVKCYQHCKEALTGVPLHLRICALYNTQMTEGFEKGPWFVTVKVRFCQLFGTSSIPSVRPDLHRDGGYTKSHTLNHKYITCDGAAICHNVPSSLSSELCAFCVLSHKILQPSRTLGQAAKRARGAPWPLGLAVVYKPPTIYLCRLSNKFRARRSVFYTI